jgi:MerR family redox-sensitive transcriptional activator SoxR
MWAKASACWTTEIDGRIALLVRMRERLTSCVGCGCLSLKVCHLLNADDRLATEGPGPRRLIHD